jgi:Ca-activated chloride channel family protein
MANNERFARLESSAGNRPPVLSSVHAQGEVQGLLLNMTLRQTYRNTSDDELETVYSFPLAWDTTLLGMRVSLNGKTMTGRVIEKTDAETRYEQAVEDGDLPVMLVSEGKQLYSARLGNLKPGDEAVIEIDYAQLLRPDGRQTRITIPTTIAPRYGRDPGLKGLIAHALGAIDLLAEYRFFLTLNLQGPLARGRIVSPSHAVSQQATERGVTVQLSQKAMLDRDFILNIEADNLIASIASPEPADRSDSDACTVLTSFVPTLAAKDDTSLALKILVDCSGSMAGDSMRLAQQAIASAIRQLRPQDQVSFSRFGSDTKHIIDRLAPASPGTLARLAKALRETDADLGGTELDSALRQVIALPGASDRLPETANILLITDGDVWDIDAIVRTARRSCHAVFAIGVGSAPAESLLRELAEVTGGAAEMATPGEDMADATMRLMAKMRSMRDLQITAEVDGEPLDLPQRRYRVAAGESVHLWCVLPQRPVSAPRIVVTDKASGEQCSVQAEGVVWETAGTVARLGAAKRLLDITDTAERREIALRYQLLTDETRVFLVHERSQADKALGMPALQQVGGMLAAGWGGFATVVKERAAYYQARGITFPDRPAFFRRQVADPVTTSADPSTLFGLSPVVPAEKMPVYTSLADLLAYPEAANQPLQPLAQIFDDVDNARLALARIAEHLQRDDATAFLVPLFIVLESLTGSAASAAALLLHWAATQTPPCVRLPDHALAEIALSVAALSPRLRETAEAYLALEAEVVSEVD